MGIYISLIGLIIVLLLLLLTNRANRVNYYLAGYFFLVYFHVLVHHVLMFSQDMFWIAVLYINFSFLFMLPGPLLFFYIRGTINGKLSPTKKDLVHFIPSLVMLFITLPWIFTDFSVKESLAVHLIHNPLMLVSHDYAVSQIPSVMIFLLRSISGLGYTGYCLFYIFRIYSNINLSNPQKHKAVTILLLFLVFQLVMYCVYLVNLFSTYFVYGQDTQNAWGNVLYVSQGIVFLIHLFILIIFPLFLYKIPATIATYTNRFKLS